MKRLQELLEHGASPDSQDLDGMTPRIHAALMRRTHSVRLLLEAGADPNVQDATGGAALHAAFMRAVVVRTSKPLTGMHVTDGTGNIGAFCTSEERIRIAEVVDCLLEAGANINAQDRRGITPLMKASERALKEVAIQLVRRGADVHTVDADGDNALTYAARALATIVTATEDRQSADSIEEQTQESLFGLIQFFVNKNVDYGRAVAYMEEAGAETLIPGRLALIRLNRIDERTGHTQLSRAIANDDVERVRQLLTQGADPNLPDGMPLWTACPGWPPMQLAHCVEVVKLLLDAGANPNRMGGQTPLMFLNDSVRDLRVAHLLLEAGANVDLQEDNETALTRAISGNHTTLARLLIASGANVNLGVPLLYAALEKQYEGMKSLLRAGADPNRQKLLSDGEYPLENYITGTTALMVAATKCDLRSVRMLLAAGAIVEAAREGSGLMVPLLLDHGADPNSASIRPDSRAVRETALSASVKGASIQDCRRLIEAGANIDFQSTEIPSAIQVAAFRGQTDIVELLALAGARASAHLVRLILFGAVLSLNSACPMPVMRVNLILSEGVARLC